MGESDVNAELEDTVTVPRLPYVEPVVPLELDFEDTFVPEDEPPQLVEPELRPRLEEPSGIELTPVFDPDTAPVQLPPYSASPYEPVPSYFRFRIGRTVVWLDAVSYVGRRPSSPRIVHGQMPRLVRVPSPGHEVSSTHIEVRQLGFSVVVTDMRSTNGSIVFEPGGTARKLRQGESVVVSPGTLVDIGDGNVMEILPLEARAAGESLPPAPEEGQH
ncbi:MAG: hypothetical protein JWR36_2051 [Glaciihabitans sp.]|nr:hypothetical protein [Glaciihabitans sp.]MDQ1571013.1 hypothetical protein [Actinomycetota bacterium]